MSYVTGGDDEGQTQYSQTRQNERLMHIWYLESDLEV